MYEPYFGLTERPFSIAPDPQYLYMSKRHRDAMAHLSYGLTQGGCFIVLTGEVGTGKTTLCRNLLVELPDNVDVALLLNSNINEIELLQSICDELGIKYKEGAEQKQLLDLINKHLLKTFADNRHTVLIIDEAQILSRDVLELIRLLTNLETTKAKLLQIILIGQPELNDVLLRNDLRQLAQRVTARYHLGPLHSSEIEEYINFRLSVAGCKQPLFSRQALNKLYALSDGIPRKINVLADHALLAAYSKTARVVDAKTVSSAAKEVFIQPTPRSEKKLSRLFRWFKPKWIAVAIAILAVNLGIWWFFFQQSDSATAFSRVSNNEVSSELSAPSLDQKDDGNEVALNDAVSPNVQSTSQELLDEDSQSNETNALAEDLNDHVNVREYHQIDEENPQLEEIVSDPEGGVQTQSDDQARLDEALFEEGQVDSVATALDLNSADSEAQLAATEEVAVEPQELLVGDTLDSLLATAGDTTSQINALRNLSRIWDEDLPEQSVQSPCQELGKKNLWCFAFNNWQQWKRLNRPALLVVKDNERLHRIVVSSMGYQDATVMIGNRKLDVPIRDIRRIWAGEGMILYRPMSNGNPLLEQGDHGSHVITAREKLNQALRVSRLPELESVSDPYYDLDMAQRVFGLQSRYDLIEDSKIGDETWLLIAELLNENETKVLSARH